MYRAGYSQKPDVLFMRLFEDLPAELRNALVYAGLGDPCTLEDYPRMTAEEIYERGVASQESHEHAASVLATGTLGIGRIAATPISIGATPHSILSVPAVPVAPASFPTKSVVSTSVQFPLSAGSGGETRSETVHRRARVEKPTGSRKRVKGAPITQKASTGGNMMSQGREKSGFESRAKEDKTGGGSPSFHDEIPNSEKSDFDVTSAQYSRIGSDMAASSRAESFVRNPPSSEGLDPTPPNSLDWRVTSAVQSALLSPSPPDILLLYWTLVADGTVLSGYQREFLQLESGIKQAADRTNNRYSREDNMSAAVWLHRRQEIEA